MQGEAFFNVQPGNIPFIVEFGSGRVEVLGTKFNVKKRRDETEILVTEGRVKVAGLEFGETYLTTGQLVNVVGRTKIGPIITYKFKGAPG